MPKLRIDLPPDVIEILGKVGAKTVDEAICQLARNFDAMMEEEGLPPSPVIVDTPPGQLPSVEELEAAAESISQVAVGDVAVAKVGKKPPHDKDGLVSSEYLKSKGFALTSDGTDENWQAIREVLSKVPEDLWATESTIRRIEGRYQEIVGERR